MDDNWINLDPENDVISQKSNNVENTIEALPYIFNGMEIVDQVLNKFSEEEQVLIDGFECKVLQPGKKWQIGKIRINLKIEFQADHSPDRPTEPESPLDDIRKMDS
ncbi:hypothetical protein NG791_05040 [Laspinema sp. D1]|uniref:KGK domain-containing protein n=1 Tax=Laspinema palackyanum TaxID=3231601 RepID=UPI0034991E51|nr:hypothetical protein [Laspinema sp. D2b]